MSEVAEKVPAQVQNGTRLPFTFARRHGVLVRGVIEGAADCVYRIPASAMALAETRRYLQLPLKLTAVESEVFDEL
ncbi:MAG: hypothetical protein ABSE43_17855, partial [Steroidobacteraceae bacterium]